MIGNIHIVENAIYSGSKSTYSSNNQGFILGSDGSLNLGNAKNYLKWNCSQILIKGQLEIGGSSNETGVLKIYDSRNNQIAEFGNEGAKFSCENGWGNETVCIHEGIIKGVNGNNTYGYIDLIANYGTGGAEKWLTIKNFDGSGIRMQSHTVFESTVYITGNITSGITVNGASTLSSTLTVNGTSQFKDTVTFDKLATFSNTLRCAGMSYRTDVNQAMMIISGTYGTLAYGASSSKRYKVIQRDITTDDIENAYNIQPVFAKFKPGYLSEEDERHDKFYPMFIAEDVEKYLPDAADHQDGLTENWNERVMIPVMFQMIKSQKAEIEELKKLLN